MDTRSLTLFLEVCRCGSISKAAENLFISRQGISQSIARLEAEIGHPLLKRASSGVEPTEAGEILVDTGQEILLSMQLCMKRIEKLSAQQQLTVVFAPGAVYWTRKIIQVFRDLFPAYQLNMIERVDMECEQEVKNGFAELGLVPGPTYDSTLTGQYLLSVPYLAIVHKDHPLADRVSLCLRDLEGQTALVQGPHHKIYSRLSRSLKEEHINADVSCVHDSLSQFSIIEETPGIVGISTKRVAEGRMSGEMVCVPFETSELAWDLSLIYVKEGALSRAAKELSKLLMTLAE